jgi:hypothetical protein
MSVIVNKNTTQAGLTAAGKTGLQSIRFIPAARVYTKAAESMTAAPVQTHYSKSNGSTPSGWTDLGSMVGNAKLVYNKNLNKVKTGIDKVLQAVYVDEKDATLEFNLGQVDDTALEAISGLSASIITSGSVVNYRLGAESIVEAAMLCVYQNKLDGKEIQFYHPAAMFTFQFDEVENYFALKCSAELRLFKVDGQTDDLIVATTIFA